MVGKIGCRIQLYSPEGTLKIADVQKYAVKIDSNQLTR